MSLALYARATAEALIATPQIWSVSDSDRRRQMRARATEQNKDRDQNSVAEQPEFMRSRT